MSMSFELVLPLRIIGELKRNPMWRFLPSLSLFVIGEEIFYCI
jgi:hypothetical protein